MSLAIVGPIVVGGIATAGAGAAGATAVTAGIVGAVASGATAYGVSQLNKGNKANTSNQQLHNEAIIKNEKQAQKLFDQFIKKYNESSEKLEEGMSIEEYTGRMIYALNNPELEAAFRRARNADWGQAQKFADEANEQNVSTFKRIVDEVSGGDYDAILKKRNEIILGENWEDLYKESTRVRSPRQIAGSVRRGKEGEAVEGQRADKFEFLQSITDQRKQNEVTFNRTVQASEADRRASERQQQRASEFLPMLNYGEFAAQNVVQPFNRDSLQAQLEKLRMEASMASAVMGATISPPQAPPMVDTTASQALTQQGTQAAIAGLASYYGQKQSASNQQSPFLKPTGADPYYIAPARGGYGVQPTTYTGPGGYLTS